MAGLHDPGEVVEELLRHSFVLLSRAVAHVVVEMLRGLQIILIVHRQHSISVLIYIENIMYTLENIIYVYCQSVVLNTWKSRR